VKSVKKKSLKKKSKSPSLEVVDAETWKFINDYIEKGIEYYLYRNSTR
jgi:hypothetical protein